MRGAHAAFPTQKRLDKKTDACQWSVCVCGTGPRSLACALLQGRLALDCRSRRRRRNAVARAVTHVAHLYVLLISSYTLTKSATSMIWQWISQPNVATSGAKGWKKPTKCHTSARRRPSHRLRASLGPVDAHADAGGTPLLDAVAERASRANEAPFHVPGHKVGASSAFGLVRHRPAVRSEPRRGRAAHRLDCRGRRASPPNARPPPAAPASPAAEGPRRARRHATPAARPRGAPGRRPH